MIRLSLAVFLLASSLARAASDDPLGLELGDVVVVSSQRVGRTQYVYTLRTAVSNDTESNALNVTASVTSSSPGTTVVDGSVAFGDVRGLQSVPSSDTFSIRQDRAGPFDSSALHFTFYYQVEPSEVAVPFVAGLGETSADAAIAAANLVVGSTSIEFSSTVPAGDVISQTPAAETLVEAQSPVDLVLSQGPEFTLELPKPYVDVPQGGALLVPVRLHRNPAAPYLPVTVTVDLAGGITSNGRQFVAPMDLLWLTVSADASVPVGGPVDVPIFGYGSSSEVMLPLHVRVVPAKPPSSVLIAAALAAGTIDYGTSLLYRMREQMGDLGGVPPSCAAQVRSSRIRRSTARSKTRCRPFRRRPRRSSQRFACDLTSRATPLAGPPRRRPRRRSRRSVRCRPRPSTRLRRRSRSRSSGSTRNARRCPFRIRSPSGIRPSPSACTDCAAETRPTIRVCSSARKWRCARSISPGPT